MELFSFFYLTVRESHLSQSSFTLAKKVVNRLSIVYLMFIKKKIKNPTSQNKFKNLKNL